MGREKTGHSPPTRMADHAGFVTKPDVASGGPGTSKTPGQESWWERKKEERALRTGLLGRRHLLGLAMQDTPGPPWGAQLTPGSCVGPPELVRGDEGKNVVRAASCRDPSPCGSFSSSLSCPALTSGTYPWRWRSSYKAGREAWREGAVGWWVAAGGCRGSGNTGDLGEPIPPQGKFTGSLPSCLRTGAGRTDERFCSPLGEGQSGSSSHA